MKKLSMELALGVLRVVDNKSTGYRLFHGLARRREELRYRAT
jgi:hypothetical protein